MSEIRLLFTGVGRRIELIQAFRTAALSLKKKVRIYGADMAGTAPALAFCDQTRRVVSMKASGYIDDLLKICKEDKIDLVIPTIDTDLMVLSEHKAEFDEIGTKVMISDREKIGICRDKTKTSGFFVECGLKAPLPVDDVEKYSSGFPAFIKPKDGSSSINAFKAENMQELKIYASKIGEYVIQPFIKGREFTIDIFCDWEGNPISIVPRERLKVSSGEVVKTRIDMDRQMIEEAKRLCSLFRPCGPITVQLIRDEENTDWFIEINPRFGGGAPLSMKAGSKCAESVLKLVDGEKAEICLQVENGAIYSRFDRSVCLKHGIRDVKGVIFDLDDTLYSERDYVRSGFRAVSEALGGNYEDKLTGFFIEGKKPIDELLKELKCEEKKEEMLEVYRKHKPQIKLYDGVRDTFQALKKANVKIGIITDGRPEGQRNKIEALGLDTDDLIVTDELGGEQFRKPCDIAFRILQNRWRLAPEEIVYVGDNPDKDFQAPDQLGMRSVYFRNSDGLYSGEVVDNRETIERIEDLLKILNVVA